MNIVFAADEKFFPGLWGGVLSTVASCSRPHELVIHVIDCGLTDLSWDRLKTVVESHPTPPKLIRSQFPLDRLVGLHLPQGKSPLTYVRLFFPDVFDFDSVLHVDADMLVFRDVLELQSIDIANAAGAAARNEDGDTLEFDLPAECCRKIGLDPNSPYFNAGLLYMNLNHWRDQSMTKRCLEFMKELKPTYVDQTAINAVMNDQIVQLDQSWNRLVNRVESHELLDPDFILHYTNEKPWIVRQKTPAALLFEKFSSDTGNCWTVPPEQISIFDQWQFLNLARGGAYRLLGAIHSVKGDKSRARSYYVAGDFWLDWYTKRKERQANDEVAKSKISVSSYAPDWLQ